MPWKLLSNKIHKFPVRHHHPQLKLNFYLKFSHRKRKSLEESDLFLGSISSKMNEQKKRVKWKARTKLLSMYRFMTQKRSRNVNEKFNFFFLFYFFVLQESHGSVRRSVICNGMENSFYCVSETAFYDTISHYIRHTNITGTTACTLDNVNC